VNIFAFLTAFFTAATTALNVYAYTYADRLQDEIDELEAKHDFLRGAGDPGSQLAADRLLARIARKRGLAAALPTPGPAPLARPGGADAGRGVSTPDR
jgi:hypothetical protein